MEIERPLQLRDRTAETFKTQWTFGSNFVLGPDFDPGLVCNVKQVSTICPLAGGS